MDECAGTVDLDALAAVTAAVDTAVLTAVMDDPFARYVLVALRGRETISIDHLAEIVVGFDAVHREAVAGPGTLERVRVHLHHVTLPKLDEFGLLAFDTEEGRVTSEEIPAEIYEFLGVEV